MSADAIDSRLQAFTSLVITRMLIQLQTRNFSSSARLNDLRTRTNVVIDKNPPIIRN